MWGFFYIEFVPFDRTGVFIYMDIKTEKKIISEYKKGKSSLDIVKIVGLSKPTILRVLNRHNLVRKRDRCNELDIKEDGEKYYVIRKCPKCGKEIKTISKDKVIACRNHFNKLNNDRMCKPCSLSLQVGEGNPFFGKKHTKETIDKMSKSREGKLIGKDNPMANPKWREKATRNLKKKWDNGDMEHARKIMSEKLKETRRLGKIKSTITSKKEKELAEEIKKPKKTKFIADDITIEALTELHDSNPNGIGILRDELVGWIKDMNKYRDGSDLQKYLSCWSNGILSSDRKTSGSSYVEKAFIPIIGGVQPTILQGVYTEENKDNGFIDRILLCYPEIKVEKYNTKNISEKLLNEYSEFVSYFFDAIRTNVTKYNDYGSIIPMLTYYQPEADIEWQRIFNRITDLQNSDEENEYIKSVLPKLKTYVCRFSLLLEILHCYSDGVEMQGVSKKSVLSAEKLFEYFLLMAKKNKFSSMEHNEILDTIKFSGKRTSFEKFKVLYEANPDLNRSKIAEQLNVSRMAINKWIKEIQAKSVN